MVTSGRLRRSILPSMSAEVTSVSTLSASARAAAVKSRGSAWLRMTVSISTCGSFSGPMISVIFPLAYAPLCA